MPFAVAAAIGSAFAAASTFVASGVALLGVGEAAAGVIGAGIVGAGVGAAGGAALGAATGGDPGLGALTGALTGGTVGSLGGAVGTALGSTAAGDAAAVGGDALVGAGAGAVGAGITGQDPLTGAAGGALSGAATGALGGLSADTTAPAGAPSTAPALAAGGGSSVGGPGVGAVGTAAPPSITPTDGSIGSGTGFAGSPELGGQSAGGTVGAALNASGPVTELAPTDAAALQQQIALSQTGDTTNIGYATRQAPGTPVGTPNVSSETGLGSPGANGIGVGTGFDNSPELGGAAGAGATYPGATGGNAYGGGVTPAAAGGGNSIQNAINHPDLGTIGTAIGNNAGWLVPAAGLALAYGRDQNSGLPATNETSGALNTQAQQLQANSTQLQSYLQSGTLPPGVQNSIKSATTAAKAAIRSQYAARGMSGSSAEQQDLANVDQQATSQGAAIATQLLNTGVTEAGLSAQIYNQLLSASIQQDQQLSQAVSGFASSLVPRSSINLTTAPAA